MSCFNLEYIWIGGNNELRSKTKICLYEDVDLSSLPIWNFDGSSTNQASGDDSEVLLNPVRVYKNPFVDNDNTENYLVLCETLNKDKTPHSTNTRSKASSIFSKYENMKPWYGIEQEFFMIDQETKLPLGFKKDFTEPQGRYYCSVGSGSCFGREISNDMLNSCIAAELNITGLNFEVAPGQCELQIREEGIKAADDLIILRYILQRVGEKHNVSIDFSAKPLTGDWNGSGCHVNFSTEQMRSPGGYTTIVECMEKLKDRHQEHIKVYGDDNYLRLTGLHETSSMESFSWGVADRGSSIRIPNSTLEHNCGYFEDRRPSSSMDPYLVLSILLETVNL